MKKVFLFIFMFLFPGVSIAYVPSNKNTQVYRWSLAAVGDTIQKYFNDYTFPGDKTLSLGYLIKFGDSIKAKPVQSPSELVELCVKERIKMLNLGMVCAKKEGCQRNGKTYKKDQMVIAAKHECVSFVDDLMQKNNGYAVSVRAAKNPGTYIKKTDKCGGRAYKVVNVVPGKDSDNKIYVNNGDGKYVLSKYTTQKNGTFINNPAEGQGISAGHTRGVYNHSYIFFFDVTSNIYELYNSGRGTPLYSVGAGMLLLPDGDYDFKVSWTKKSCDPAHFGFRVDGQKSSDRPDAAHTNGVIFKGQVVTLEDLGHIITGMHQEDSIVPDRLVEQTVSTLQGGEESEYANKLRGEAYAKMKDEKDDVTFADTQTMNQQRAYNLARSHMAKKYSLSAADIKCSGECNYTSDDFVTCYYKKGQASKVVVYTFDDICNSTDKNIPKF